MPAPSWRQHAAIDDLIRHAMIALMSMPRAHLLFCARRFASDMPRRAERWRSSRHARYCATMRRELRR